MTETSAAMLWAASILGVDVMPAVLTIDETAQLLRLSTGAVGAMTRDGRLPRVPGARQTRIPTAAVLARMEGRYDVPDVEPDGPPPAEEASPRRGDGGGAQGPLPGRPSPRRRADLASQVVRGGDPVPRRTGPEALDVVVRRVEG